MKRILVIGSNSFSGASFAEHALASSIDVLGISRSPEPPSCFLPYSWTKETTLKKQARGQFHFIQANLNTQLDEIMGAANAFEPECVVNFSAQGMVAQSWENPLQWFQTNLMANVALSERLKKVGWLKRYIHASTPEVYGHCSGVVTESAPINPSSPYAASKAASDLHFGTYFKRYAFPVIWTRAANVYGPGQQLYRIIPRTILSIKLGQKLQLHGGGHSIRSFIHIADVACATLLAALKGTPGETYHLSTDLHLPIRTLVERICSRMKARFEDAVEVTDDRVQKDAAYLLDCTKIRTELGWSDTVGLDEGIDQCITWVEENFQTLKDHPLDYVHRP